jgi:hypothetical protein
MRLEYSFIRAPWTGLVAVPVRSETGGRVLHEKADRTDDEERYVRKNDCSAGKDAAGQTASGTNPAATTTHCVSRGQGEQGVPTLRGRKSR